MRDQSGVRLPSRRAKAVVRADSDVAATRARWSLPRRSPATALRNSGRWLRATYADISDSHAGLTSIARLMSGTS